MQEVEMEVLEASNEVEIKQEPAQWLQKKIPVAPLWASGSLECNQCEFRTKYESILRDHRELKHKGGYPLQINTNLPQIHQQNASNIPKWAMGGLKCDQCNFTTKYQTILEYHQQKEKHVIMNTFLPLQFPCFQREIRQTSRQREVKHPKQNKLNRLNGKTFASIIMEAIQSSKKKMPTLQEIYSYFEKHFPNKKKRHSKPN